jgi:AcrR family transcriptional regulator
VSVVELRNEPVQKRSQDRLEALLEAARLVWAEVGRDRLTTGMVAEKAGCSIGTVYRYFPDRVMILDAIAPDRDAHLVGQLSADEAASVARFGFDRPAEDSALVAFVEEVRDTMAKAVELGQVNVMVNAGSMYGLAKLALAGVS